MCAHATYLNEKPMITAGKSGFIGANKGFPPMSAEPEIHLIIWGPVQQDLFLHLHPFFCFISTVAQIAVFLAEIHG